MGEVFMVMISSSGVLLLCKSISPLKCIIGASLLLFTGKLHCLRTF